MKSSSSLPDREDLVLVGRVTGAHGIRGTLRVHSYAESMDLYQQGKGAIAQFAKDLLPILNQELFREDVAAPVDGQAAATSDA